MSSSSSTSRCRSSLSDDILIEIFAYLPLDSIYKFKCLSKVWLFNLSDPNFIIKWYQINNKSLPWIHYHTIISPTMSQILCLEMNICSLSKGCNDNPLRFRNAYHELHSEFMSRNEHLFSFKFIMNEKPSRGEKLFLFGSSNGLVLCWSVDSYFQSKYHVCNPLTQKWVSLPSPPRSNSSQFDLHGIFIEYSSAFASCYKVVRIPEFDGRQKKFNVDVFYSDLGVWQSFEVLCDTDVVWSQSRYDNVVILNGVLFWIDGENRMLVYNLNQNNGHRCSFIDLPDEEFGDHANDFDSFLGESEGWVCYARTRITGSEMTMSVWVLDEVKWKILHKDISIDIILAELRSRRGEAAIIQVLGFSPADRNVVLLGWRHCVWGFNIQTRSVEELCLDNRHRYDGAAVYQPFMLKPMPTVLPPPSWIPN